MIEKEASAKEYMYNYPPKPGEDLTLEKNDDEDKNKNAKAENSVADKEQGKVKKQYEDLIESNRKASDALLKQTKVGSAQEIEELTVMFSKSSRNLIVTTIANRELQKKFDAYFQQSDTYIKECELKISHQEIEVKNV